MIWMILDPYRRHGAPKAYVLAAGLKIRVPYRMLPRRYATIHPADDAAWNE